MIRFVCWAVAVISVAIALAAPAAAGAASDRERLQAVADGLTADAFVGANLLGAQQAFIVPGTALTLSRPGEPTLTVSSGVRDVASGTPMRAGLPQPIGSGTKPMTAVAVLRLVQRGRLSLDAPLSHVAARHRRDGGRLARLVGRLAARLRGVTVRQLLSMTSGLADYDESPAYGAAFRAHPYRDFSFARLATYGLELPPAFNPGAGHHTLYSNTNYVLAGMVAEAVGGRPFKAQIFELFHQAGMPNSSYGSPVAKPVHGYQPAYPRGTKLPPILAALAPAPRLRLARTPAALLSARAPGAERGPTTTIAAATPGQRRRYGATASWPLQETGYSYRLLAVGGPAGGVMSSSEDLARFWRSLFSGRLLGPAAMRQLRAPVAAPPNPPGVTNFYGLGVQRQDVAAGVLWPGSPRLRLWYKLGDVFGYTSASYYVEGARFDGWVLINTTNLFPSPVGDLGVLRETLRSFAAGSDRN